jgi:hypothetical protein
MSTDKNVVAYPVGGAAAPPPYHGGEYVYSVSPTGGGGTGTYANPNSYASAVSNATPTVSYPNNTTQVPLSDAQHRGVPRGQWRDGLFDCFNNLWPSCGCNFIFHGAWLVGQSKYMHSYVINQLDFFLQLPAFSFNIAFSCRKDAMLLL